MRVNSNEQRTWLKMVCSPNSDEPLIGKAESIFLGGRPKILAKLTFPTAGKHLGG